MFVFPLCLRVSVFFLKSIRYQDLFYNALVVEIMQEFGSNVRNRVFGKNHVLELFLHFVQDIAQGQAS
jgi:hypothetical protein